MIKYRFVHKLLIFLLIFIFCGEREVVEEPITTSTTIKIISNTTTTTFVNSAREAMERSLEARAVKKIPTHDVMELGDLVLESNEFMFEGEGYVQKEGNVCNSWQQSERP